jgi:hypothetical protein
MVKANDKLIALAQEVVSLESDRVDMETIKAQLRENEKKREHNENLKRYQDAEKAAQAQKDKYDDLTRQIEKLDREKEEAIKAAGMPIEGISFDDDGVLFNGIPYTQLSSAEQVRISTAMAMAMNPELRIIRISDGSLLDSDNMAMLTGMAKEKDYQIWIERVDESGTTGIIIEDGEVVA